MSIPPVAIAIPDRLSALLKEGLAEHSLDEYKVVMQPSSNHKLSVESIDVGGAALDNYVTQHRKEFEQVFQELERDEVRTSLQATRCKVEEFLDNVEKRKGITKERLKRVSFQMQEKKLLYLSQRNEVRTKEIGLVMQAIEKRIDCSGEDFSMIATLFQFIQREALEITDTDILQVLNYANNVENSSVDGECVYVY